MSAVAEKPLSLHQYAKHNGLDLNSLRTVVKLLGYVWKENFKPFADKEMQHYSDSVAEYFPLIPRLSPLFSMSPAFNNGHENFNAMVMHKDFIEFNEHTKQAAILLVQTMTLNLIAEYACDQEEETGNVVQVSREKVLELVDKIANLIRHASYLLITQSPTLSSFGFNRYDAEKSLLRLLMNDCALSRSLSRSYPNTALWHGMENNKMIAYFLHRLPLKQ